MSIVQKKQKYFRTNLSNRLRSLTYNLWWTWNPEAQQIFKELSPLVWRYSNHNAVAVMQEISEPELDARLRDIDLSHRVTNVLKEFDSYMINKSTWVKRHAKKIKGPIAYFSAEFGIHESLPIYSGGLGILAGDHIKSASDLGLPFIGIGLFYNKGYFNQRIFGIDCQEEGYVQTEPESLPFKLVTKREGGRLLNTIEIGEKIVFFQTWYIDIGRVRLYLFDTNIPENEESFKELTSTVYGGNVETRIGQEILLGIGGVRLLQSLGIEPQVFHMNEGHSAFLVLELLKRELSSGKTKSEAEQLVKEKCVFTTHTPVPAGHDRFDSGLIKYALGKFWTSTGLTHEELIAYGRVNPNNSNEFFTMTVLALKMSRAANGVSELHGQISRAMWKDLFPDKQIEDVPIGHITNGVHTPGWATAHAHDFWNKRLGFDWTEKLLNAKYWKKISNDGLATDEELWALRYTLRRDLVEYVRRQFEERKTSRFNPKLLVSSNLLSNDALTIGFARRFASYKRAPLIFRNLDTIASIVNDANRPVQFIFAGKAHPKDNEGKWFIKQIIEISKKENFFGKVVFLEDYDINVARHLISGSDVWLNNPRRPLEASGTSGMKVLIHGGLNLSIMDGWWREGYNGKNGWKIGDDTNDTDENIQDEKDFKSLIKVLTESVIPEFYNRDEYGIPRKWINRIRNSMETLIPRFNTDKMVAEYINKYYLQS